MYYHFRIVGLFPMLYSFPNSATATLPKRGLAFNEVKYVQNWNHSESKIKWAYNWDSSMDADFPLSMEFVPMLWSSRYDHTSVWFANVNNALSHGSEHLLSFNEPDHPEQASMSVLDAVNAYHRYLMPYAHVASLGAPAVTNGPDGWQWLRLFLEKCLTCKIDFVPIHWYDSAENTEYFQKHVEAARQLIEGFGIRNIWITEFNAAGDETQQTTFLRHIMPWMDQQGYISRYSWFMCKPSPITQGDALNGSLVLENGDPSAIGNTYAYE